MRAEILRECVNSEKVSFQLESHLVGPKSRLFSGKDTFLVFIILLGIGLRGQRIWTMRPKASMGWSNTAVCLAGWRRVTQEVVILYVIDGHTVYPNPHPRSEAAQLRACGISAAGLLLNVHKQQTWWKSHMACRVISLETHAASLILNGGTLGQSCGYIMYEYSVHYRTPARQCKTIQDKLHWHIMIREIIRIAWSFGKQCLSFNYPKGNWILFATVQKVIWALSVLF